VQVDAVVERKSRCVGLVALQYVGSEVAPFFERIFWPIRSASFFMLFSKWSYYREIKERIRKRWSA